MKKLHFISFLTLSSGIFSGYAHSPLYPTAQNSLNPYAQSASTMPAQPASSAHNFEIPPADVWITVFVHGIVSIKPHLTWPNLFRFFKDDIENTVYSRSVRYLREDEFFYKNQAMQQFGLHEVSFEGEKKGNPSRAMATVFDSMWLKTQPYSYGNNHYYTYGWSGLLSPKARYRDAQDFYFSLLKVAHKLEQQYGKKPKIRVIGYSHGGNVSLNLATVRQQTKPKDELIVDELYLFGVPIQHDTDYLINDQTFSKIYHFYSTGDRIQKLDFFSLNRFFSGRKFIARRGFQLPTKLQQIQIRIMRNIRTNKEYHYSRKPISSRRLQRLRNTSPGHIELWFFGWTPVNYRDHFPLNPLPAAAFSSFMIEHLKTIEQYISKRRTTIIEFRVDRNLMLIQDAYTNRILKVVEMPSEDDVEKLKKLAEEFRPDNYTSEEHERRIEEARYQGLDEYRAEQDQEILGKTEFTAYPFPTLLEHKKEHPDVYLSKHEDLVHLMNSPQAPQPRLEKNEVAGDETSTRKKHKKKKKKHYKKHAHKYVYTQPKQQ